MATLDQERAKLAFEHIAEVKGWKEPDRKKYASIVHAMPALLRSAGLSQALHFVLSRKSEPQRAFLDHMAAQLRRANQAIRGRDALLGAVRSAEMTAYLRLSREALACVDWYRRFVQGELGIAAGEADVRDD